MKSYTSRGRKFQFNDHVCVEMLIGVTDEKRTGRLVQVRKGCGQFGSSVYLIRLRDGSLMSFENVMIRRVDDREFIDAFYISNGREAPQIPDQPPFSEDSETVEYSIKGEFPEIGFIIENPRQPETPGSFAIAILSPN